MNDKQNRAQRAADPLRGISISKFASAVIPREELIQMMENAIKFIPDHGRSRGMTQRIEVNYHTQGGPLQLIILIDSEFRFAVVLFERELPATDSTFLDGLALKRFNELTKGLYSQTGCDASNIGLRQQTGNGEGKKS